MVLSLMQQQFGYKRQRQLRKKLENGEDKNLAREKGKKNAGDQGTCLIHAESL